MSGGRREIPAPPAPRVITELPNDPWGWLLGTIAEGVRRLTEEERRLDGATVLAQAAINDAWEAGLLPCHWTSSRLPVGLKIRPPRPDLTWRRIGITHDGAAVYMAPAGTPPPAPLFRQSAHDERRRMMTDVMLRGSTWISVPAGWQSPDMGDWR